MINEKIVYINAIVYIMKQVSYDYFGIECLFGILLQYQKYYLVFTSGSAIISITWYLSLEPEVLFGI